jgi:hypothetical protein
MESFHLSLEYKGKHIEGEALPVNVSKDQSIPLQHRIILDGKDYGIFKCTSKNWSSDKIKDKKLVEAIGNYIHAWYE